MTQACHKPDTSWRLRLLTCAFNLIFGFVVCCAPIPMQHSEQVTTKGDDNNKASLWLCCHRIASCWVLLFLARLKFKHSVLTYQTLYWSGNKILINVFFQLFSFFTGTLIKITTKETFDTGQRRRRSWNILSRFISVNGFLNFKDLLCFTQSPRETSSWQDP